MEGPSLDSRSCFTAAESLVKHSTDYGRLNDDKTITLLPECCCFRDYRTAVAFRACE